VNQIINMVLRQVTRRLINLGIDKGMDAFARRKAAKNPDAKGAEPPTLTPEQQKIAAENKKRAKQAMRIMRRAGR